MIRRNLFAIHNRPFSQGTSSANLASQVVRTIASALGFVAALTHCSYSFAGSAEVNASEIIAITIARYEKCTGDGPAPAKLDRFVRLMLSAGVSPQDFATGADRATAKIERLYPGRARPPQQVCTEATREYNGVFGAM
jgi:hypothetical protein